MKKIKNISLIVLSMALLGLWSCNKSQSIENTANESQTETFMPEIDGADDYFIMNEKIYDEFLVAFQPWSSKRMAP